MLALGRWTMDGGGAGLVSWRWVWVACRSGMLALGRWTMDGGGAGLVSWLWDLGGLPFWNAGVGTMDDGWRGACLVSWRWVWVACRSGMLALGRWAMDGGRIQLSHSRPSSQSSIIRRPSSVVFRPSSVVFRLRYNVRSNQFDAPRTALHASIRRGSATSVTGAAKNRV